MSMNCYLISPRGFCFGVKRAVEMARQMAKLYGKLYITEDIVHNKILMNELQELGVVKVESIEDVQYGRVFMVSAHGISPESLKKANNLTIIDGTCPVVKSVQNMINKSFIDGHKIIIIGDRLHKEIISYLGYADTKNTFVISGEIDIDLLPSFENEKVMCFTQTTLSQSSFDKISNSLKNKIPHLEFSKQSQDSQTFGNICAATIERQAAVKKIANDIDLFIIVGSTTSSNTKELKTVAMEYGAKKTILIDSKNEFDFSILDGSIVNIAITSGASVPEFLVEDLVQLLQEKIPDIKILTNDNS